MTEQQTGAATAAFRDVTASARRLAARGAIIEAAIALYAELGFDKVIVDDIANAVGISVRTFYRYFSSKEDVLLAFALRSAQFLPTAIQARPKDEAPLDAAIAAASTWSDETEADFWSWARIYRDLPASSQYVQGATQPAWRAMVAEAIRERPSAHPVSADEAHVYASVVVGVLASVSERALETGVDRRTLAPDAFAALRRALTP